MFICKFCGRECKNDNSLRNHERLCKLNPNRQIIKNHNTINKDFNTTGFKWMNNGIISKMINPKDFEKFLSEGWIFGMDDNYKYKISKSLIGKSIGKCLDEEKEKLRREKISKSMKNNNNWKFNKSRGIGKKGKYNGIYCDSTWELAYLVYHIENDLFIERCKLRYEYEIDGETHIYCPDFITDNGIIEIKGYKDKKAIIKEKYFSEIKIISKLEIQPYLNYVINKYGKDFYKKLYDKK